LETCGPQQGGGVVDGEPQGVGPHLVEPAFQPESGNRDGGVRPAGHHQLQALGAAPDQPAQVAQDLPSGQLVHVVEDEPDGAAEVVQRIGEVLHDVGRARQGRRRGDPPQGRIRTG